VDSFGGRNSSHADSARPDLCELSSKAGHPRAIAFVVLCIASVFLLLYLRSYESTDDAQVDGHLDAVSTRVMGMVQRVYVEDNQTVTAGQLLAELDPGDFETALAQAKANYVSAEAQWKAENPNVPIVRTSNESEIATNLESVDSARAAVVASEQDYQSRLTSLRQAEANDTKAQRDLVRYRGLVNKEEISHEQYDGYLAVAKTQAAAVVAAQAAADAAQKGIEQRRAQLAQAGSTRQRATLRATSPFARQVSRRAWLPFLPVERNSTKPHSTSRTRKFMRLRLPS
jgi:membrane fusion protein (multidrug efflux system)